MDEAFSRNILYWGEDFQNILSLKNIFVFGLGGVGGYVVDALARCGIEKFTLVDYDIVSKSNINRQIIALNSTVGCKKTELFKNRLFDINKNIEIKIIDDFYTEEKNKEIFTEKPDFVVDAIDTLKSKIKLIKYSKNNNINIITSFGAGNRADCTKLRISDLSEIKPNDSFSKNVLSKLKKENILDDLPVVWSEEKAKNLRKIRTVENIVDKKGNTTEYIKFTPASTPIVPAVAGYMMANYVLNHFYINFLNHDLCDGKIGK